MRPRMFELGERLQTCAGMLRRGGRAADIGTDHARLPVWLIHNGVCDAVIAADVATAPLEKARRNIEKYGLSEKITTLLSDGLSAISPDDVDDIVIAGMGGELIASIINAAQWLRNERFRLVLQPMSRAAELRRSLFEQGFSILQERAVRDCGRIYTVICAQFTGKTEYTELDVYAGGLAECAGENSAFLLRRQARLLRDEAGGLRLRGREQQAHSLEQTAMQLDALTDEAQRQ